MHQTSTGTKKNKKNKNSSNYSEVDPYFLEILVFCFFWCLCRFGASSGLFFLFFLVPVQVWYIYWFVCFFDACAGFGDSRLCMFGSWPYFKLMFQRSKHTVIFEQLCHHTGCLTLIFNSLTTSLSLRLSLSLSLSLV